LNYFRNKYQGISLFHHFADDSDIIKIIYDKYTKLKLQNKLTDQSIKEMPLFILSPDDNTYYISLDLAIKSQKPNNFEIMVDMLKEFDDICSSKMMLGSVKEMMTHGVGRILAFFEKSQFNPPLMRIPFTLEWP